MFEGWKRKAMRRQRVRANDPFAVEISARERPAKAQTVRGKRGIQPCPVFCKRSATEKLRLSEKVRIASRGARALDRRGSRREDRRHEMAVARLDDLLRKDR